MDQEAAIGFVLALGRALHRYGTPANRLEEALRVCCDRLELDAEVFTTPTAIVMSFGRPTELRTRMMRVEGGELDMTKLSAVDALVDEVASHRISSADGVMRLDAIVAGRPELGHVWSTLSHGMTCGAMAVFFGGSLPDVALAGAIGIALGVLAQVIRRSTDQARIFEVLGSAIASLTAGLVSSVWSTIAPSLVTVASLIVLLPGLSITVAVTELATRNLISGTARLMSAVIVLLQMVVGVALGDRLANTLVAVHHAEPFALPDWTHPVALVIGAVGIAILIKAPLRTFGWILIACVTGYLGTRVGASWLGPQMAALVGAFAVGILGNGYARWFDRPSQIVTIPAVLLLVPGSMGFRGMTSLLGRDTISGLDTLFAMFVVAIAIVAGLLVATAVVSPRRSL